MSEYLGIRPTWTDSSSAGGSSFEIYVHHAVAAINAGLCNTVVVSYGSNQKSAAVASHRWRRSRSWSGAVGPERAVRAAVRIHDADVALRARGPSAHARVRYDARATGRGRGVGTRVGAQEPEGVPLRGGRARPSTTCSAPTCRATRSTSSTAAS